MNLIKKVGAGATAPTSLTQGQKTGEGVGTFYELIDWLRGVKKPPPPPPPPPKSAYDIAADQKWMEDWVTRNEGNINEWLSSRPSANRSYDDLQRAINSGNIRLKPIPKDEWDDFSEKQNMDNAAAWYSSYQGATEGGEIYYPEGGFQVGGPGSGSGAHEIMHFFSSHTPGRSVGQSSGKVPQINPYQKLDIKLGGWLPSLHPGGRRPWTPKSDEAYHPWFDEGAFDRAAGWDDPSHPESRESVFDDWKDEKIEKVKSGPGRLIKKASENLNRLKEKAFPTPYNPPATAWMDDSLTFNKAFDSAKSSGLKTFHWRGKEYTTKVK